MADELAIVKALTPPQVVVGRAVAECYISAPGKLHVHITGPGAETLLNDGPPAGKKWLAIIQINLTETDI